MNYVEYKLTFVSSNQAEIDREIAMAELAEMGFDSFSDEEERALSAYITEQQLSDNVNDIDAYISELDGVKVEVNHIETVNWNKEWESNFSPIDIDGICTIRAPFHDKTDAKYQIEIMPKMSFGTGHHATTYLMVRSIINSDFNGMSGLDMGSGTGVLAIAAIICGAKSVDCVDIDEWAFQNCIENGEANGVDKQIRAIHGDASSIEGCNYDFILANINRNILLADMSRYVETMNSGARLFMSGFLDIDVDDIRSKAEQLGLIFNFSDTKDGWALLSMSRI